ncbi:hypothetical protein FACS1894137_10680 [Spirochaetia bacterium]|nr:hypothetical protein FACS1894137_10680 [Spirochaetia bacterium]
MDRGNQRKNAENILNVKEIPCNNQITRTFGSRLIDEVKPEAFDENFKDSIGWQKNTAFLSSTRCWTGFGSNRPKKCFATTACISPRVFHLGTSSLHIPYALKK